MQSNQERLGVFPYIVAALSYIPLLGVPLGAACLIYGLLTNKRGRVLLAVLGGGGILFTVLLYGGLYHFGFYHRGGSFDEAKSTMAISHMNSLVASIEFHKQRHGTYPESLDGLLSSLPPDSEMIKLFTVDPFSMEGGEAVESIRFFYHREGDAYYLRSVGPDRQPFTDDDVLPNLATGPGSNIGLRLSRP